MLFRSNIYFSDSYKRDFILNLGRFGFSYPILIVLGILGLLTLAPYIRKELISRGLIKDKEGIIDYLTKNFFSDNGSQSTTEKIGENKIQNEEIKDDKSNEQHRENKEVFEDNSGSLKGHDSNIKESYEQLDSEMTENLPGKSENMTMIGNQPSSSITDTKEEFQSIIIAPEIKVQESKEEITKPEEKTLEKAHDEIGRAHV